RLVNSADVTMEGDLVLEGTGVPVNNVRGIYIIGNNTALTMNGGEISGNTASNYVGRVCSLQSLRSFRSQTRPSTAQRRRGSPRP
ncbi:MAG: hypothetical protein LBP76_03010, partial [Treponema sp.]|nr:hypothetical protein [Treponema sp.]